MKKLKKVFSLFLLISLLFFIVPRETFAAVTWNWTDGEQLRMPTVSYAYLCNSSTCAGYSDWNSYDLNNEYLWSMTNGTSTNYLKEYQIFSTSSKVQFDANDAGFMVTFMPTTYLLKNYIYSLSFYMCTTDNVSLNLINSYSGRFREDFNNKSFPNTRQGTSRIDVTNRPFTQTNNAPYTTCRKYNHTFKLTTDRAEYIGLNFNSGTSSADVNGIAFFGYYLTSLGADVTDVQNGVNNVINQNNAIKDSIDSTNDTLNNSTVTESNDYLKDNIINNEAFNQNHGLTAIVQAPINFLKSLNSKTCSNITIPIPHLGNASIPCMSTIYSNKFESLYIILKNIINGLICYRLALSVVFIIKGAKDPNEDKIEVMDL